MQLFVYAIKLCVRLSLRSAHKHRNKLSLSVVNFLYAVKGTIFERFCVLSARDTLKKLIVYIHICGHPVIVLLLK